MCVCGGVGVCGGGVGGGVYVCGVWGMGLQVNCNRLHHVLTWLMFVCVEFHI